MSKDEFKQAFALAQVVQPETDHSALALFHGCGLPDFKTVHCTLAAVAVLIRYQCAYMFGGWDHEALAETADIARRKFQIIDA
jgi:hypothetical protein